MVSSSHDKIVMFLYESRWRNVNVVREVKVDMDWGPFVMG